MSEGLLKLIEYLDLEAAEASHGTFPAQNKDLTRDTRAARAGCPIVSSLARRSCRSSCISLVRCTSYIPCISSIHVKAERKKEDKQLYGVFCAFLERP